MLSKQLKLNTFSQGIVRVGVSLWIATFLLHLAFPLHAQAVVPPDFVVNAGLQIVHILGIVVFACSTASSFLYTKYSLALGSPGKRFFVLTLIICGFALACYLSLV
jgi:hypothetical protein